MSSRRPSSAPARRRRLAVAVGGLAALLAVAAVASSGSVPGGSGGARRPAEELVDAVLSLLLVLVLAGSVGLVYVSYLQRVAAHEARRRGESRRHALRAGQVIAVIVLLLVLLVRFGVGREGERPRAASGGASAARTGLEDPRDGGYRPRFAPVPVAVVLGTAALAAVAAYLASRARRRALPPLPGDAALALALADVLEEALDDLRAERDVRAAVIAAYARLERTLAALGLARRPAEAPGEYLRRVLGDLEAGTRPAARLTELFALAKFSHHELGREAKEEAIDLLEQLRRDLRAAEAARTAAAARTTQATA